MMPLASTDRLGILSHDLWSLRDAITPVTGGTAVRVGRGPPRRPAAILGWAGPRGRAGRALALGFGVPFRAVAVGPLGWVRPGSSEGPFSLRIAGAPLSGDESGAGTLWRDLRLSWRNDGRDTLPPALANRRFVLALAESTDPHVLRHVAAVHPGTLIAVLAGPNLDETSVRTLADRVSGAVAVTGTNPHALFDAAEAIHAVPGSALGREARLAGHRVHGHTTEADASEPDVLVDPIYIDPWTRRASDFAHVAPQVAWLRDRFLENDRPSVCIGVSRWKRERIARFLDGPDGAPIFTQSVTAAVAGAAARNGRVVAWETRMPRGLDEACTTAGLPLARMEDGFLRSVGLGAAFRPGASAILDTRGIYYDPGRPSDLEHILAETAFTPELVARARALRERIVRLRLSKYNVGRAAAPDDLWGDMAHGRRTVLVPGQVEDDASVMLGSPQVRSNLALLAGARAANPDAFLIFKPHPDVEAGLRQGRIDPAAARHYADRIVSDLSIADLLERVDAVETMTSLTGFEALLRGRDVAVHGAPFYAGWGLTLDRHRPPRRGRTLTLDELVAGALILYPRYVDPVGGLRCPPEILVDRLAEARDAAAATPALAGQARAAYVRARYALLGPLALMLRRARGSVKDGIPPPPDAPA